MIRLSSGFYNPILNGNKLRAAILNATAGDVIEIGPGFYNTGNTSLIIPGGVTLQGSGSNSTIVESAFVYGTGGDLNCSFTVQNLVTIQDLTLQSTATVDQQAVVLGYPIPSLGDNQTATINNCVIEGGNFQVYIWSGFQNRFILNNCVVKGRRWLVSAAESNGPNCCLIDLYNCQLTTEGVPLVTYQGAQGNFLSAVVSRGGRLRTYNCQIELTGDPTLTTYAAWTPASGSVQGGEPFGLIELHDTSIRVTPNGSPIALDIAPQSGQIQVFGGSGSGPNGAWVQ